MNTWQVAGGDDSRDYSENVCLRFGVMLIGSGKPGDYFEIEHEYEDDPAVRQFAEEAEKGDRVILKYRHEIVAVGRITSEYSHKKVFGDVDGFYLQHCRRVRWKRLRKRVPARGLARRKFSLVYSAKVLRKAEQVWSDGKRVKPARRIPSEYKGIRPDKLRHLLKVKGLPASEAKNIADEVWRLHGIAKWFEYDYPDDETGEHEMRTFLSVPLFESLGWTEKSMRIEWKEIDVALFEKEYSKKSKPLIIVESKRLGMGLLHAPQQAKDYAKQYNESCRWIVVSDGIRYMLFERQRRKWHPVAYMNLLAPTDRDYPFERGVRGAVFFLSKLWRLKPS